MRKIYLSIFLSITLISSLVFAQTADWRRSGDEKSSSKVPTGTAVQQSQARISSTDKKIGENILERTINPDEYIIGPGDELAVYIWSGLEQQFFLIVNPEGYLSIPTVGDVFVSNESLNQAKLKILEAVKEVYKAGEVTTSLNKLKRFRISVSGVIENPGIYDASAADRVSSLLDRAGVIYQSTENGFDQKLVINDANLDFSTGYPVNIKEENRFVKGIDVFSSKRNVLLIHNNGDTSRVDLLKFARGGDVENNPYLKQGDAIYTPPMLKENGIVSIYGAVKIPGDYEYVKGDRLKDILKLCVGFKDNARLDKIIIARCDADTPEYQTYNIDLLKSSADLDFPLLPDDRIFVSLKNDYHLRESVTVRGEVIFPGVYPIKDNVTRLKEIVERAGGFTEKADIKNAVVVRPTNIQGYDTEYERLKQMEVRDMSFQEYLYFRNKNREKPVVNTDFSALFDKDVSENNIILRNGDIIDVPSEFPFVKVTGQVEFPGLIEWKNGADYKYYIEKAGGYLELAQKKRVRLIKPSTGKWVKLNSSTIIENGDTIFIPEKSERTAWSVFKEAMITVTQIATLIVVVNSLK
jgi:protein involved in polysaccharide export with SLBB domain